MTAPPVYLTRTYRFCAGHRLHDPARDEEWNERVFGKCSRPGGHGHNYTLEVTVSGTPDAATGWVVRLDRLDEVVERQALDRLDHHNLNDVLPSRFGPAPTTEVLAIELWDLLAPHIPAPARLHRLEVRETEKNTFDYYGPSTEEA